MQKETFKISIILFVILITGILYLSFGIESKKEYEITTVEIEGNLHLTQQSYFEYAGLSNKNVYSKLTLSIIRDRIQKHPYVKQAAVEYVGNGEVKIQLVEKAFKALILSGGDKFLLTEAVEILPVLANLQKLDYPVIQMNNKSDQLKPFSFPKRNIEIETSYKILSAAKLLNPGLYKNLSEIDFRNSQNVVLYFSSVDYPVILGTENEIKKMVVFEKLWESLSTVQASRLLDYVDLRFTNKIYLGIAGENLQVEETQS